MHTIATEAERGTDARVQGEAKGTARGPRGGLARGGTAAHNVGTQQRLRGREAQRAGKQASTSEMERRPVQPLPAHVVQGDVGLRTGSIHVDSVR